MRLVKAKKQEETNLNENKKSAVKKWIQKIL